MVAALTVSVILVIGLYYAVSNIFSRTTMHNAQETSRILAKNTFNSMYQVMSQGWTRKQLEGFILGIKQNSFDADYDIVIYRGEIVNEKFDVLEQENPDDLIVKTFATGEIQKLESGFERGNASSVEKGQMSFA